MKFKLSYQTYPKNHIPRGSWRGGAPTLYSVKNVKAVKVCLSWGGTRLMNWGVVLSSSVQIEDFLLCIQTQVTVTFLVFKPTVSGLRNVKAVTLHAFMILINVMVHFYFSNFTIFDLWTKEQIRQIQLNHILKNSFWRPLKMATIINKVLVYIFLFLYVSFHPPSFFHGS